MKSKRRHLDILFRRIQPEAVYNSLGGNAALGARPFRVTSHAVGEAVYLHYARSVFEPFSDDEIGNLYRHMQELMQYRDGRGAKSVFALLPHYTEGVLREQEGFPVCRAEEFLNWRSISFLLGQDLLTTSHFAFRDAQSGPRSRSFGWPAAIRSDDPCIRALLRRGVSENHYHLYGSTQSFALSWMCLMNHPRQIGRYLREQRIAGHMFENLQDTPNLGEMDVHLPWEERLYIAAELRALLFEAFQSWRCGGSPAACTPPVLGTAETVEGEAAQNRDGSPAFASIVHVFRAFQASVTKRKEAAQRVGRLRFGHGVRYLQPDGRAVCLDYAIPCLPDGHAAGRQGEGQPWDGAFRALSGERSFLYGCFLMSFRNIFSQAEQDLFYLYLLLKSQFRSELIQVNKRVGFRNFSSYQDRKYDFFGSMPEYANESVRLSAGASLCDGSMQSLELRIGPGRSPQETAQEVLKIDSLAQFACRGKRVRQDEVIRDCRSAPWFYTLHFLKRKPSAGGCGIHSPRNANVRNTVRQQAAALAAALSQNGPLCGRIRGIDAASNEIGCRPEVFAPDFRFLRSLHPNPTPGRGCAARELYPRLGITYHVGEDFLDIADGLRAIDEAVRFLELQRGDRLGHALALGVDPRQHYAGKGRQIMLPKQDWLDNLVWLLYRGNELGVTIPSQCRAQMEVEAQKLFQEICGKDVRHGILLDYYQAWKLRGDAPELYQSGRFASPGEWPCPPYQSAQYQRGDALALLRGQEAVAQLYWFYHYGSRKEGEKIEVIQVQDWYIDLLYSFQTQLQIELATRGIAIECNPTSNVLIGTFGRYEHHPIFRFNRYQLDAGADAPWSPQLSVSINTDDQGVFDTSLANEYELIAACLRWQKSGKVPRYHNDCIYGYLDHVREMGNLQVFPGAEQLP